MFCEVLIYVDKEPTLQQGVEGVVSAGYLDTIIPVFCSDAANSYRRHSLLAADTLHPTAINYRRCPHTQSLEKMPNSRLLNGPGGEHGRSSHCQYHKFSILRCH